MWSVECRMCNVECGMWSVKCGMWSIELKMNVQVVVTHRPPPQYCGKES